MNIKSSKSNLLLVTVLFLSILQVATAHNKVVVIPMSGDDLNPLQNVVSVALSNGDFSDPVAAFASIIDASASNPYLVVIAPGVYTLSSQLIMKEYVSIAGGGSGITILRGTASGATSVDASAAVVVTASNASIKDLSIENIDGTEAVSMGIFSNGDTNLALSNLSVLVSGGAWQRGYQALSSTVSMTTCQFRLENSTGNQNGISLGSSTARINDVSITILGGAFSAGIHASNSASINVSNTRILVSDSTSPQQGVILQNDSSGVISNTDIAVTGSLSSKTGVLIASSSDPSEGVIIGSRITVSGGFSMVGVSNNTSDDKVTIRDSFISAATRSVSANTGVGNKETYISDTILDGQVNGDPVCSFVFNDSGVALTSSCADPV